MYSQILFNIHLCCVCVQLLHCVLLFVTLWIVTHQAPLSVGFSRQQYWRGLPCPHLGDVPNPVIELVSLTSPTLAGRFFTTSTPSEALIHLVVNVKH